MAEKEAELQKVQTELKVQIEMAKCKTEQLKALENYQTQVSELTKKTQEKDKQIQTLNTQVSQLSSKFGTLSPLSSHYCGTFGNDIFFCRGKNKGCTSLGGIWGSEMYTSDTHVCTAAKHSGAIGDNGGIFRLERFGSQNSFASSTRNSITSSSFGNYGGAYKIYNLLTLP